METLVGSLQALHLEKLHSENAIPITKLKYDVEHNVMAAMSVVIQSEENHLLDLNIGNATMLGSQKDSITRSSMCDYGNFSALVSPGEGLHLKWTSELSTMRILLSSAFVDRVLQTENVRFRTQSNFNDPLLNCLAEKLKNEKWKSHAIGTMYGESLAVALVVHLASNYSRNGKKVFAPKGKLSSSQLHNLYEYASSSINRNIKLSELAAVVHMSEFHFARLFKQTTGISPYRFVLQLKIDQAKLLIKKEKKSCSDIAYLLNFSDQAHFSHVFKKVAGCSPRSFMNAVR